MRHVMVDLETLGLAPDSVIVSIGAVTFTDEGIEGEGYWPLTLNQPDRHVDLSTIQWWMQQTDDARAVFKPEGERFLLTTALEQLAQVFDPDTCIWSNGANFDEVLLAHAYKQQGKRTPWSYKNVRCFRTLRAQYPDVSIDASGIKHNALADAQWQTNLLLEIVKQKGIKLT